MASATNPLATCPDNDLDSLLQCLWSFPVCTSSHGNSSVNKCQRPDCTFQRMRQLAPYLLLYKQLSCRYETNTTPGALPSHEDLRKLINTIRNHPDLTRADLVKAHLATHAVCKASVVPADRDRAIDLAVRVMTMVNCQIQNASLRLVEYGAAFHGWSSETTFTQFMEESFPVPIPLASKPDPSASDELLIKTDLTASRVIKKAKLRFKATDDLRKHLVVDRKLRIVHVFHHVAFLKENLRCSLGKDKSSSMTEQLKSCAIPRQIALEVLDSIQKILFRHSDANSRAILRSLISKEGFDPECLNFESSSLRLPAEEDVIYQYFGSRMAELWQEIEDPSPDGPFEQWLERRSGGRYMMLATLIGVLFAVLLGLLSLMLSAGQTYISYQAWQHDVHG